MLSAPGTRHRVQHNGIRPVLPGTGTLVPGTVFLAGNQVQVQGTWWYQLVPIHRSPCTSGTRYGV